MGKRAKFKVGQVVAAKQMSGAGGQMGWSYFRIYDRQFCDGWEYREAWTWHKETSLRPLTAKERGK